MQEEIKALRKALPEMKTIDQSIFFTDAIDNLIESLDEQIYMLENSLIVLRNDLAVYALKYSIDINSSEQ